MKKLSLLLCLISLSVASSCSATEWHDAAKTGNIKELERLIKTEPQNSNLLDKDGFTPYACAYFAGYEAEAAMKLLIENGADTKNFPFPVGNTVDSFYQVTAFKKGISVLDLYHNWHRHMGAVQRPDLYQ